MEDKIAIVINSLIYILSKFEDNTAEFHKTFKILYFAEQKHLAKYGKSITDDSYAALPYGPVPSLAYDIVKYSKGTDTTNENLAEASKMITVNHNNITSNIEVDLEWLSKTEIDCLDESFNENKDLTFGQLTDKSHDIAWKGSTHWMDTLEIAKAGGANESVINYIVSKNELKRLRF
jgi:uncharacterized phage-associated protein